MKFTAVKLVAALTLALFAAPLAADAPQVGKVHRIGYLGSTTASGLQARAVEAFRLGLLGSRLFESSMRARTRSGVGGVRFTFTPSPESVSATALVSAGTAPMTPPSPTP